MGVPNLGIETGAENTDCFPLTVLDWYLLGCIWKITIDTLRLGSIERS
jgi:hypothetical protein